MSPTRHNPPNPPRQRPASIDAGRTRFDASLGSAPAPASAEVPRWLHRGTAYAWRLVVLAAALAIVGLVLAKLRLVVLALVFALFATVLLQPLALWLRRRGWPEGLAAAAALSGGLALAGVVLAAIAPPFLGQLDAFGRRLGEGIEQLGEWLFEGPLGLSERELDRYLDDLVGWLGQNGAGVLGGLLSGALLVAEIAVALAVAMVLTYFFLRDGERIWAWVLSLAPADARRNLSEFGERFWQALGGYLRGMTVVALFDALLIGLALFLLDVPAALPLAVLTFLGAYIPIAGAWLTGLAAVLVALVANGPGTAALVAAAVLVVQQVESNVLHPVVVGRAVCLHPVAILLSVLVGALVAGVLGAFLAVPLVAVAARAMGAPGAERIGAQPRQAMQG